MMKSVKTFLRQKFGGAATDARRRGNAARDARQWTIAAGAFHEYLTYRPNDAAIWVQLGHMLREAGRLDESRPAYERAVALDPKNADAQLYYGRLLKMQGDYAAAAQAFDTSFALDGNGDAQRELIAPEIAASLGRAARSERAPQPAKRTGRRNVGTIDNIDGVNIDGWAVNPDDPSVPAEIEFRVGDRLIGGAVTNRFRADVALLGLGNAETGFLAKLDLARHDRRIVSVRASLKATGEELDGSPFETTGFSPFQVQSGGDPVTNARVAIAKRFVRSGAETALFVSHSPDGVLKPHVLPYLLALRANGIDTLLIVVAERPTRLNQAQLDAVAGAIVRENVGYDFGAWGHALHLYPEAYGSDILYLVNDSMFGPNNPEVFGNMIDRVRESPADLVGLTDSQESGWHIQSFFLAMKKPILSCIPVQNFFGRMVNLPGKQAVIDTYEVKLAPLIEANGFRTEVLFESNDPRNATLFAWRELIEDGFPFVKTLLFRQQSILFDIEDWEEFLHEHDFDVQLLKDMLKHQGVFAPAGPGFPLLAMPADDKPRAGERLKVAFYGPWNYDNGLGFASRGIAAAIRTTGAQVNLHPVKKPFHIHRPLVPDHDILDFEGAADIAVIHLNPDSWHLLTVQQRQQIQNAKKRIGYWVWEMAHLPEAWHAEFSSVDRIWAPSGYCAAIFDAQSKAPVDVVPHAVEVPGDTLSGVARQDLLETLGLDRDRRIILYVFDGSSYLVRKNPHALVRAFAESELGKSGWTLILKTKHLMDRPEDGKAFQQLAESTPDVLLLDRSLPSNQLNDLFAAADIYASPHCSEGFGLTIAEAMAAGKAVVATDYSGSTEFLDASCGYPVPAEPYRLDEDFGHYTRGGTWARIDETALAETLRQAAAAIESGDHAIGDAARRRIQTKLSLEAVGKCAQASFEAVFADSTPHWRTAQRLDPKPLAGKSLAQAELGEAVTVATLKAGTFVLEKQNELDRVPAQFDRWLLIVPADARINPDFLSIFTHFASSRPDVSIFYADDVAASAGQIGEQLRLKPEFDLTLFVAQDYIGAPLIVRGSALHALGGLHHDLGAAALTDIVFRASACGMSIARLPYVMIAYPKDRPIVPPETRRAVFESDPALGAYSVLPGLTDGTLQLARKFAADAIPHVTLLVPTRRSALPDGTLYVERLLDSLAATDWPMDRLHVLVGDDVTDEPAWAATERPFAVRRIATPRAPGEPFNYAAKMNVLWRAADTNQIVMVNDDVQATGAGWLKALMTFAMSDDVGAVGPLLMYEDGSVQHAGVVGGLFGLCAHAWLGRRSTEGTYQDWLLTHREWSMVTGAVIATRKTVMERIGGFEERFALEFNDLDLCLRMRVAGLRVVYTPHARMIHAEKASRGQTAPPPEDIALFIRRWRGWIDNDPAFHPRMQRYRFDLEPGYGAEDWFVR